MKGFVVLILLPDAPSADDWQFYAVYAGEQEAHDAAKAWVFENVGGSAAVAKVLGTCNSERKVVVEWKA